MKKSQNFLKILLAIGACLGVATAGSFVIAPTLQDYYLNLIKPSFTPPNEYFAPIWTALYLAIGIACYRVWRNSPTNPQVAPALRLFFEQLVVNLMWPFLFFGLRTPILALLAIIVLLIMNVRLLPRFWAIDRLAGILLVPYCLWIIFATVLNVSIVALNT